MSLRENMDEIRGEEKRERGGERGGQKRELRHARLRWLGLNPEMILNP